MEKEWKVPYGEDESRSEMKNMIHNKYNEPSHNIKEVD